MGSSEAFHSEVFLRDHTEGMWSILCRAPMKMCDFSIIASWLWLNSQARVVYCVAFYYLSVGLLLGDSLFEIIICHYCFFRMCYFNVVHVFYVMSNSLTCNIFCLILKSIRSYCKRLEI